MPHARTSRPGQTVALVGRSAYRPRRSTHPLFCSISCQPASLILCEQSEASCLLCVASAVCSCLSLCRIFLVFSVLLPPCLSYRLHSLSLLFSHISTCVSLVPCSDLSQPADSFHPARQPSLLSLRRARPTHLPPLLRRPLTPLSRHPKFKSQRQPSNC